VWVLDDVPAAAAAAAAAASVVGSDNYAKMKGCI
jgi:hypothetical protein